MKLNIGCGGNNPTGYIGLDIRNYGQEILRDVLRGIPFSDGVFDEVLAVHFLEHIHGGDDIHFVLAEVYRVLKPDGLFVIYVPHSMSMEAHFPDHLSYWNEKVFEAAQEDSYDHRWKYQIKEMKSEGIQLMCVYQKLPLIAL